MSVKKSLMVFAIFLGSFIVLVFTLSLLILESLFLLLIMLPSVCHSPMQLLLCCFIKSLKYSCWVLFIILFYMFLYFFHFSMFCGVLFAFCIRKSLFFCFIDRLIPSVIQSLSLAFLRDFLTLVKYRFRSSYSFS